MTLATAKTLDRIKKYIDEYWYDSHALELTGDGSYNILGCKGLKANHNVVPFRGGYKFQRIGVSK